MENVCPLATDGLDTGIRDGAHDHLGGSIRNPPTGAGGDPVKGSSTAGQASQGDRDLTVHGEITAIARFGRPGATFSEVSQVTFLSQGLGNLGIQTEIPAIDRFRCARVRHRSIPEAVGRFDHGPTSFALNGVEYDGMSDTKKDNFHARLKHVY